MPEPQNNRLGNFPPRGWLFRLGGPGVVALLLSTLFAFSLADNHNISLAYKSGHCESTDYLNNELFWGQALTKGNWATAASLASAAYWSNTERRNPTNNQPALVRYQQNRPFAGAVVVYQGNTLIATNPAGQVGFVDSYTRVDNGSVKGWNIQLRSANLLASKYFTKVADKYCVGNGQPDDKGFVTTGWTLVPDSYIQSGKVTFWHTTNQEVRPPYIGQDTVGLKSNSAKELKPNSQAVPTPTGLTAYEVSSYSFAGRENVYGVALNWFSPTAAYWYFSVERRKGIGGSWVPVTDWYYTNSSFVDWGMEINNTYFYRVRFFYYTSNENYQKDVRTYTPYSNEAKVTLLDMNALAYYPLPKAVRLLDTRTMPGTQGKYTGQGPFAANTFRNYMVANLNYGGVKIPAQAKVLEGNIQAASPEADGFLTVYPGPGLSSRPIAPTILYTAKQYLSNTTNFVFGDDGSINIYSSAKTDALLDITGYYAPPGTPDPNRLDKSGNPRTDTGLAYFPLAKPIRLMDTRQNSGVQGFMVGTGAFKAGTTRTFTLTGVTYNGVTIPSNAEALVGNIQVAAPEASGYLTAYPGPTDPKGSQRPTFASMLYNTGQFLTNSLTLVLGDNGKLNLYSSATTHVLIDITGYYAKYDLNNPPSTALFLYAFPTSMRLLDTRPGSDALYTNVDAFEAGITRNYIAAGTSFQSYALPPWAKALATNVQVVQPKGAGYLTAYPGPSDPSGRNRPIAATELYNANQAMVNTVIVSLGNEGSLNLYSMQPTHLVLDIQGYFAQ